MSETIMAILLDRMVRLFGNVLIEWRKVFDLFVSIASKTKSSDRIYSK